MKPGKYPLFKGAARTATWLGIPRGVVGGTLILMGVLFMNFHISGAIAGAIILFIEWCITKYDEQAFRIWWLAVKTKLVTLIDSAFRSFWGGSSRSPVDYGRDI